jgi:ABC-type ATPase with predicted acetyltransferase domain
MKLKFNIKFTQKEYTENETNIIKNIFGVPAKEIYYKLLVNENIDDKHKFINFTGISGSGKTVIKNEIKKILETENKHILDFDDLSNFEEKYNDINILELFNIVDSKDEILKVLNSFGLFEMRILLSKIGLLSQGQRTRLKYIFLFFNISKTETSHILIDEFLTFVDELTSINFSRSIEKFLRSKDIKLYTFGVNSALVGQFEDISYQLGNSSINAVIENGNITYKY